MSQFASRNTPIPGPLGSQQASLTGSTALLSALVTIPPGATSATVQGQGGAFAFRLDGQVGAGPGSCLSCETLRLANGPQVQACALASNGAATTVVVQFYTGSVGPYSCP